MFYNYHSGRAHSAQQLAEARWLWSCRLRRLTLVSRSQTTISENGWQSIHFNCSLIQLVVPEPEGVLVTWIHVTCSYLFRDVLCKFILCCSTIPLYAIVTSSVHLCDISLSFLLYCKILAVVLTLVMFILLRSGVSWWQAILCSVLQTFSAIATQNGR